AYSNCVGRAFALAQNSSPSTTYRAADPSDETVRETLVKCATRRTNRIAATNTPITTPIDRLWVMITGITVTSITIVSLFGMRFSVEGAIECQSKLRNATINITATSAPIGIRLIMGPRNHTRISRHTKAVNVDTL